MMHRSFRPQRAYSLLEVLITVAILGLLLFAIGDAISHVLDVTTLGVGRNDVARSADELAARLASEARSSTAVFVPSVDVLGSSNVGPAGGHEVDFFRKVSDGSTAFVAYRFDAQTGDVTRYEYAPTPGATPAVIHQDVMASGVSSLSAVRMAPSAVAGVAGAANVHPVNIYYGSREIVGGNGIVSVSIAVGAPGGPQRQLEVHLSSRAAPTEVTVLVGAGSPPPSPSSSPISVAFALMPPSFHPPHGPNHGGDPGDGGPNGGIHGPGIAGTALYSGTGGGATTDFLSLYAAFSVVTDGTYSFRDAAGNMATVTISCDGACPPFAPNPVATSGNTIIFHTIH